MSFLVVSGITVPVAPDSATKDETEIGDKSRAFDGTMKSTVRTRKRMWSITTPPMLRADADTLETALKSTTLPLVCSGDLLGGTVNCFAEITPWKAQKIPTGHRAIVSFNLYEA